MAGPIFASPFFGRVRESLVTAIPASKLRRGGRWRDGLGTILHLGCFAMVGILTVYAFFGIAVDFLPHPTDKIPSAERARYRGGEVRDSASLTAAAPVPMGGAPPPQSTRAGAPMQSAQLAQLAAIAPAFLGGPELRSGRASQDPERKSFGTATSETVSGPVTEIRDAMTWVIGGQIVYLWGIRSDSRTPAPALARFADKVKAEGPISCRKPAHSTRYRCLTASHEDVAEMALLSGVALVANGAPVAYRAAAALTHGNGSRH